MCVPSTAPMHCRQPRLFSKSLKTCAIPSPKGIFYILVSSSLPIPQHTSCTMTHRVPLALWLHQTWPMLRWLPLVAKRLNVIALLYTGVLLLHQLARCSLTHCRIGHLLFIIKSFEYNAIPPMTTPLLHPNIPLNEVWFWKEMIPTMTRINLMHCMCCRQRQVL